MYVVKQNFIPLLVLIFYVNKSLRQLFSSGVSNVFEPKIPSFIYFLAKRGYQTALSLIRVSIATGEKYYGDLNIG